MRRGPGLVGMAARMAVVAGTATAVSGRVARRQHRKYADQDAEYAQTVYGEPQAAPPPQQYAPPPPAAAPAEPDYMAELEQPAQLRNSGVITPEEFDGRRSRSSGSEQDPRSRPPARSVQGRPAPARPGAPTRSRLARLLRRRRRPRELPRRRTRAPARCWVPPSHARRAHDGHCRVQRRDASSRLTPARSACSTADMNDGGAASTAISAPSRTSARERASRPGGATPRSLAREDRVDQPVLTERQSAQVLSVVAHGRHTWDRGCAGRASYVEGEIVLRSAGARRRPPRARAARPARSPRCGC